MGGGDGGSREEGGDGGEEELVHFEEGVGHRGGGFAAVGDGLGGVGLFADAGVDDGFEEEFELVEAEVFVAADDVAGEFGGELSVVGGFVAVVVEEVAALASAAVVGCKKEVGERKKEEERGKDVDEIHCV